MIRNEPEFRRAAARLTEQHLQLVERREQLQLAGLADEQIEELVGKLICNCQELEDQLATYERRTARTLISVN